MWRAEYRTPIVLLFPLTAASRDGDFPWSEALQRVSGDGDLLLVVAAAASHYFSHHRHCRAKTTVVFLFALVSEDGDYVWDDSLKRLQSPTSDKWQRLLPHLRETSSGRCTCRASARRRTHKSQCTCQGAAVVRCERQLENHLFCFLSL